VVLKLHGALTPCTQRVLCVLYEKGAPFELIPVDLATGEHKSPEHLEKQPFGLTPFLDDGGFILYESRAIAQYIATKYANKGVPLIPTDPKENALFQQAVSIETSYFNNFARTVLMEKVIKPKFMNVECNQALYTDALGHLCAHLDVYDKILSKQKYLAGDNVTLADLYHLSYGAMLPVAGSDAIQSRPNVARWFNDISSRKSWQTVLSTSKLEKH